MFSKIKLIKKKPIVTVIIIAYDMPREVPRTVHSFLQGYQLGIDDDDVEVLVMENGSQFPISPEIVSTWPKNVRYIRLDDASPSPANALNEGVRLAKADVICPVIDGARMVTPGVLRAAIEQMRVCRKSVVATIGYHLGNQIQQVAVKSGYCEEVEDKLLDGIGWPENPYQLFSISCLGGSAKFSLLGNISESNVLFLSKTFYWELGGYDEKFDFPGGGIVNLDFFKRCVEHPCSRYVLLVGEASFHQYHGGVTTSRSVGEPSIEDESRTTWQVYMDQYVKIRGKSYISPTKEPILYGFFREEIKQEIIAAALDFQKKDC